MKRLFARIFFENFWLKLVSLALAFVLFLYVQGERRKDVHAGALVKLSLVPPRGKVLTIEPIEKISVQVRGTRNVVQRLVAEGIAPLEIDLEGRTAGPLRFTPEMFRLPSSLAVETITPPEVDVTWDDYAERTLPLRPRVAGQPAPGFRVTHVDVNPTEATVRGARAILERLQEVALAETRIDGRSEDVVALAPVRLGQKFVTVTPESAQVSVRLRAEMRIKRVGPVAIELLHRATDLEMDVRPGTVREAVLEGPASIIKGIDAQSLRAVIDVANVRDATADPIERTTRIEGLPPGVRVLGTTPPTFMIRARRAARERRDEAP
jgi:hypothetical protein